jgi:hypothetical protein
MSILYHSFRHARKPQSNGGFAMSWLTYLESAIFQTPDAGSGANTDFDLSDIDSHEYPGFYQAAQRAGWDNLSPENRAEVVDRFVQAEAGAVLTRAAQRHGYDEKEVLAHFGVGPEGGSKEKPTTLGPFDWLMKRLFF